MSSTSKYANLPFIASGERDVYETDDLPESDQQQPPQSYQQSDSSVEIITTNTLDAFNKFSLADSSSSALKSDQSNESKNVSLVEKYKQIKSEIEDLKQLIEFTNNQKQEQGGENQTLNNQLITEDIDQLFENLKNLHDACYEKFDTKQLIKELTIDQSTAAVAPSNDPKPPIVYELYQKPDKESLMELARVNSLEQRLKKIETTLGLTGDLISSKSNQLPLLNDDYLKNESLMNIIINLNNKVMQLDYQSIDRLDVRLQLLLDKLQQIKDKKSTLNELDKEDKLNELYDNYVKLDDRQQQSSTLLNIIERLKVMNDIQNQASTLSNTLRSMETMQNDINNTVKSNQKSLNELKELFQQMQNVQSIVDDFQQRLNRIKKST